MTTISSATLMDPQVWTGKIFNGDWIASTGGQYKVVEPATGNTLGVIGRASVDDVRQAAERAAEAQKAWAHTPFDERARVLRRAGQLWEQHAAGVLHVLPGGADIGEAVVTNPHVRVVSFTGSTAAGRLVGELAARHLKRVHLELGGNSALIILDDADLDRAVSAGAWGSYFHQGQICMAASRHLVHERIADAYIERLAATAERLTVGDPAKQEVVLGPIIDERQRDKVHGFVTASVDAGARLAAGGRFESLFYRPTVLADVTPGMAAYDNEIFGPVAPVTRFSTLDEAAALASGTEYGLSLGILTQDVMKGLELAERIPSGIVHINDQTVNDEAVAPFGGVASSGTGSRFGGAEWNIEAFTETQWVTVRDQSAPRRL